MNSHSKNNAEAISVLLVDDDIADRRVTARCLSKTDLNVTLEESFDVDVVNQLAESGDFQIILMDYRLPDGDAFDLFKELLETPCSQRSGIVMLTGRGDEQVAAQSIQLGAQEYLAKSTLTPHLLRKAIEGALEKASLMRQLEERDRELHQMSFYDSLTTLPNRQLFMDRLEQEIRNSTRAINEFSVLMMDLNKFKTVNDTYGHHVGDQLLVESAKKMQEAIRESDTVARLGGDEFAALLPSTGSIGGINCAAEKIMRAFDEPMVIDGKTLDVGVSVGAATFPEQGKTVQDLLRMADMAMYECKRAGGATVVHGSQRTQTVHRDTCLLDSIDGAIKRDDELFLVFQPQVCLETGLISGAEALVRWCHPELGLVMPMEFVPLAEQSDHRIDALTLKIVEMSLEQMHRWADDGCEIDLSINLSACVVHRPSVMREIVAAITRFKIEPKRLCFEVTETGLMSNPAVAARVLETLSDLGCRISIDDFGMGYSSLKYLSEFSIDEIKIDRGFVNAMNRRRADAIIVESVLALGRSFDVPVVAEGIENTETQHQLLRLGCATGQGYLFAKPMMAEDFAVWRREHELLPLSRGSNKLQKVAAPQEASNDAWMRPTLRAIKNASQTRRS
ncbi:MAG: putative bifunctional diguanylate cyclase/phosphodiesterase [Lysobacterales bacterium]